MNPKNLAPAPLLKLALPICLASLIGACDSGSSAVFTAPAELPVTLPAVPQTNTVVESVSIIETDSTIDPAATLLADRASLGAVRIMATGDSITHGIVGASSYRKAFTNLLSAANCSFEMVGSQNTSLTAAVNTGCEDTGTIGDGWGWDGEKSCMVDAVSVGDAYIGAHEAYSAHRADHFLTGNVSSAGSNAGISASMAANNPDVVLLHVGSVDLYNQQSVASTLADIKKMIDVIYETKPETVVFIANVIPWFSTNPYAEIGRDITALGNGIERMVARENNPLLKLVDVRSGFTSVMMMSDLIHPNEFGESHMASAFNAAYQSIASCSEL